MHRPDDFATRRQHLVGLSEAELEQRFWQLANRVVEPLIGMARTHTSPSIERSVLLRMGFSSVEAQAVVKRVEELGLLGHGAGHVIWRLSRLHKCSLHASADILLSEAGGDEAQTFFGGCR